MSSLVESSGFLVFGIRYFGEKIIEIDLCRLAYAEGFVEAVKVCESVDMILANG